MKQETYPSWYIIIYKFGLGLIELASGLSMALFRSQLIREYRTTLYSELSEDPHDILARLSMQVVPNVLTHNTFLVIYLILLGAVKIAGAVGLIYHKNWGVDLIVGMTVILLPFQLAEVAIHPSLINFLYITFGVLIALYLVEFNPKAWVSRILGRYILHLQK